MMLLVHMDILQYWLQTQLQQLVWTVSCTLQIRHSHGP